MAKEVDRPLAETHPRVAAVLVDRPWAMHPDKLAQVAAFVEARLEGRNPPEAFLDQGGMIKKPDGYEVVDGVAVIPVTDVLDRRMNLFTEFSGGTSTQILERQLEQAGSDPAVSAILLDVDSPGGSVLGVDEAARAVADAGQSKPVVAYAGGMACSAAYWIASAAHEIVAARNAHVGSIGVVCMHYDWSERDEREGLKVSYLVSGRYKAAGNPHEPLEGDSKNYLQEEVDDLFREFAEAVAANRGLDVLDVVGMQAKIFIAEKARTAGLVDHLGNFNDALALAREKGGSMGKKTMDAPAATAGANVDLEGLTLEQLRAARPDLEESVQSVVVSRVQAGTEKAVADAVNGERQRILGILDLDGDASATREAISSGESTEAAGLRFYQAEKAKRGDLLTSIKDSAPESPGAEDPPAPLAGKPSEQVSRLAAEKVQADKNLTMQQARQLVYAERPDLKKAVAGELGRVPA